MLTPNAVETKAGNWEPIVVNSDREWFPNEHFPRHLRRTKLEAIEYAERVISGRYYDTYATFVYGLRARSVRELER